MEGWPDCRPFDCAHRDGHDIDCIGGTEWGPSVVDTIGHVDYVERLDAIIANTTSELEVVRAIKSLAEYSLVDVERVHINHLLSSVASAAVDVIDRAVPAHPVARTKRGDSLCSDISDEGMIGAM